VFLEGGREFKKRTLPGGPPKRGTPTKTVLFGTDAPSNESLKGGLPRRKHVWRSRPRSRRGAESQSRRIRGTLGKLVGMDIRICFQSLHGSCQWRDERSSSGRAQRVALHELNVPRAADSENLLAGKQSYPSRKSGIDPQRSFSFPWITCV